MRLVIAEKRSVAFAIAQALGGVQQGDGYVSAGGALISWAQGHLVELSDPEEYSDMPWSAHKWTMESLPIDPKSWRWRLSGAKGAAQRYRFVADSDLKAALDDDTSHSGGIGTPATRAGILESLVKSGYLQRKGKQLRSTPAGRMLVGVAIDELKDVKLTAQWEQSLADIEQGKGDETVFLNEIRTACAAMPGRVMEMTRRDNLQQLVRQAGERESFGPCPRCGKPVVKTGSVWQCSSNKSVKDDAGAWKLNEGCGYKIFAEKFGKKLTDSMVRRTLEGKRPKVSGLKSKAGKTFDARLVPDRQYGIGLSFDDLNRKKK